MLKSFKFRLYPNQAQAQHLAKVFGSVRWIYNAALEKKVEHYQKTGKTLSYFSLSTLWLQEQKLANKWLSEVYSQSLCQSLLRLENAFTRFFQKKADFPAFKKRSDKNSAQYTQGVKVDWKTNRIQIPKCGKVLAVLHRKFEGKIKTCTVSKTASDKFFISILVEDSLELPKKPTLVEPTQTIGIDLGLTHFAILSDGTKIDNPRHLSQSLRQLKHEQRKLSRKQKGSKNRDKQRLKVARIHERITNQRNDFLHKLSSKIVGENQTIIIESLSVRDLLARSSTGMSRAISDVSWSKFVDYLTYKCDWQGKNLFKIGRFDPSTKTCSCCGFINPDLTLKDREWSCPKCGVVHDRDLNAAQNIKNFGLINIGIGQPGHQPAERIALATPLKQEVQQ